jgi:hypothetical protein
MESVMNRGTGDITKKLADISQLPIVAVSGDKSLSLSDAGKIQLASAAAVITVPPNSSVAFGVGTQIIIMSSTANDVAVAAGEGVTIRSKSGNLKVDGQYVGVTLIKTDTDTWYLIGALKA